MLQIFASFYLFCFIIFIYIYIYKCVYTSKHRSWKVYFLAENLRTSICFNIKIPRQDALDAACQVASRSIDQLIWQAPHDVARAVTLFGPGVVVLPMLGSLGDAFTMHSISEGFLELPLYCLNLFGYCFFAAFGPSQKKAVTSGECLALIAKKVWSIPLIHNEPLVD